MKEKDGKKHSKAPKIQRLVTPLTLQRKRHRRAIKRERINKVNMRWRPLPVSAACVCVCVFITVHGTQCTLKMTSIRAGLRLLLLLYRARQRAGLPQAHCDTAEGAEGEAIRVPGEEARCPPGSQGISGTSLKRPRSRQQ